MALIVYKAPFINDSAIPPLLADDKFNQMKDIPELTFQEKGDMNFGLHFVSHKNVLLCLVGDYVLVA